ncbi:MAG TPA: carboxylesterase family protein, partial [Bryobacteraceae bacterium]|nr:carboxylesterase family protein [Bryobacteraceae bacterium]
LTFKGVPYGADTGGENRWLPAKPPKPWEGEYPALTYGPNCPQRLHDWSSEQTFLQQWTDGWQSEDMLAVLLRCCARDIEERPDLVRLG